ncbi:hypothetical protein RF11_01526 [Thelohanellus kitauei]|uniref:Uncharacterized protein n=1 Tax=Thelohanellus kitauei TaxID=669202 RepID=A0A0C2N4Z1_THEKT|nr:hypothetical protein RF11_01526 [Thelohanellus kitauei]
MSERYIQEFQVYLRVHESIPYITKNHFFLWPSTEDTVQAIDDFSGVANLFVHFKPEASQSVPIPLSYQSYPLKFLEYLSKRKRIGLMLVCLNRKLFIKYERNDVSNLTFSKLVQMRIHVMNMYENSEGETLMDINISGWRIGIPSKRTPTILSPHLFYHPSWEKFRIKFTINDLISNTNEISAIDFEYGGMSNVPGSEFIFENLHIQKFKGLNFRMYSRDFSINHVNIIPLFPLNFQEYHFQIDGLPAILEEYTFRNMIIERRIHVVKIYGINNQIRMFQNSQDDERFRCLPNRSKELLYPSRKPKTQ